jgi:hypothetical protein
LGALQPETTYYYIAGDSEGGYSKEFTFTSAPLSSTNVKNFTFAVFADLGHSPKLFLLYFLTLLQV